MATIEELMRDAFERDRLSRPSPQAQAWQASRGTTMGGGPAPGAVPPSPAAAPTAPGAAQPGAIARVTGAGKRLLGGAAKTGAAIVGPAQIGMGANEIAKGNTLEGAARLGAGALATAQMLPQKMLSKIPLARGLPGPVGLAAAASLSATDAMGLPAHGLSPFYLGAKAREAALQNETTRGWINTARGWFGEAPLPAQDGRLDLVPPATAAQPATAAKPEASAGDWYTAQGPVSQGPVSQGPVSQGPVSRRAASQSAQQRVAQLQQMAGQELMRPQELARPPVAEVAVGQSPIQVFGPGGQFQPNVADGVMELPAWEGDALRAAPPEGKVLIDRGGRARGMIQSYADTSTGAETAVGMPELDGTDSQSLFKAWQQSAGNDDPRVAAFHKSIGEMLGVQIPQEAGIRRTELTNEGRLAEQQEQSRATLGAAATQAGATKYVADRGLEGRSAQTEVPVLDESGNQVLDAARQPVFRKVGVGYDAKSGRWKPLVSEGLQPSGAPPGMSDADWEATIQAGMQKDPSAPRSKIEAIIRQNWMKKQQAK